MEQVARNLTDSFDGFLRGATHLIHDRDTLFTQTFDQILKSGEVTPIKEECLSRVVVLGERHLRLLVREYIEHYRHERNHQGLGNRLLSEPPPPKPDADVGRRAAKLLPQGGRVMPG
jgi:putative transposase